MAAFALAALALAITGIYAVVKYTTNQRAADPATFVEVAAAVASASALACAMPVVRAGKLAVGDLRAE
jgi:hypothetical protein